MAELPDQPPMYREMDMRFWLEKAEQAMKSLPSNRLLG
jgi:hypothetical protein